MGEEGLDQLLYCLPTQSTVKTSQNITALEEKKLWHGFWQRLVVNIQLIIRLSSDIYEVLPLKFRTKSKTQKLAKNAEICQKRRNKFLKTQK